MMPTAGITPRDQVLGLGIEVELEIAYGVAAIGEKATVVGG